ncbi:hypothetical protein [uncultured Polaribacter sp.]|nr:hypothetical protein [uncultured Polaribacter sp.]
MKLAFVFNMYDVAVLKILRISKRTKVIAIENAKTFIKVIRENKNKP